jgi:hypothetical protein
VEFTTVKTKKNETTEKGRIVRIVGLRLLGNASAYSWKAFAMWQTVYRTNVFSKMMMRDNNDNDQQQRKHSFV